MATEINHMVNITHEDFNKLKKDLLLLEGAYFRSPYESQKTSVRIDYKETIRLIKVARNLNKLNIKLNRLYEDFKSFVGSDQKRSQSASKRLDAELQDSAAVSFHIDGKHGTTSLAPSTAPSEATQDVQGNGHIDVIISTQQPGGSSDFYKDFLFGLRRQMPLALSTNLDLHAKGSNINITKDMFKRIVSEILDYEKNYNHGVFTSGNLYEALKYGVVNNGKEILLPYVISNVLTYLKDSNFIGHYGMDKKNSFRLLDRDGLKLWANSIL